MGGREKKKTGDRGRSRRAGEGGASRLFFTRGKKKCGPSLAAREICKEPALSVSFSVKGGNGIGRHVLTVSPHKGEGPGR